jgi:GNAT superfamily N-acetyltransferase
MKLRPATPEDAESVLGLIVELATYEREPDAVEATAETLRAQMASEKPPFECLLAEIDGEVAGFALFFENYSTWRGRSGVYLEDLFVKPTYRGRGIGRALFREVARRAVERGAGRFEWAVLDWNQPAIDFYLAHGAVRLDEWTVFRLSGEALKRAAE